MFANLIRDEDEMPVLKERFAVFHQYMSYARQTLLRGRGVRGRRRRNVGAAIGHALSFTTWRSLAREQGLDDGAVAALMTRLVATANVPR